MISQKNCPSEPQLRNLLAGKLANAAEAETVRHIEQCEDCQRMIEQLAPARDELLPFRVRGAELQLETREHALLQAIGRLHANGRGKPDTGGESASDDDLLQVLAPSNLPGSLGRLGPYEVTEVIGRGGMGTVFKATDTTLDRVVAVKILSPALTSNATARKRFVREARSAAAVVHDHVITIHAVDEANGQPYLVMQFIAGLSLQEKIDRCGPLEVKEILRIAKQVAEGLAAAHEQGLVHRDIKPSNVLLENGVERVKITDFGLARAVDDATVTHTETIAGTPQYMAPEQARGEPVNQRSDLFSLGSVLYTMCTGRPPFRADSSYGVLRRIADEEPRQIDEVTPDIPKWLCQIIAKLMAKRAADRFESARQVTELLGECLAHVQQPTNIPLPQRCLSSGDRSAAFVEREATKFRPSLTFKLILVAVIAAVILFAGIVIKIKRDNQPDTVVEVAEGSQVKISDDGTVAVTLPESNDQRAQAGRYEDRYSLLLNDERRNEPSRPARLIDAPKAVDASPPGIRTVELSGAVRCIDHSPDSSLLAAAAGDRVHILDAVTGKVLRQISGHQKSVWCVLFAPNGKLLVSSGRDGTVRFWDVATGQRVAQTIGHEQEVRWVSFSPDGHFVAAAHDRSPDYPIELWSVPSGEKLKTLHGATGTVYKMSISPNGALLASAESEKGRIHVWDLKTTEIKWTGGHDAGVTCIDFSPDGKWIVSGGWDNQVQLWDARDGRILWKSKTPDNSRAETLRWWPDSQSLLFGLRDGTMGVIDANNGEIVQQFDAHKTSVYAVDVSPDAKTVVSGSGDRTVRFWNVVTEVKGSTGPIESAISPDAESKDPPTPDSFRSESKKSSTTTGELSRWQGTWKAVRRDGAAPVEMIVDGDEIHIRWSTGSETRRKLAVDATNKYSGKFRFDGLIPIQGVYKLAGERLTICCNPRGSKSDASPTDLPTSSDHTFVIAVFEREKTSGLRDSHTSAAITWGDPAENGLQVGVAIDPRKDAYSFGDVLKCRFFYRNAGKKKLEASFPRRLSSSYVKVHVVDDQGSPISTGPPYRDPSAVDSDLVVQGPTGWVQLELAPGAKTELSWTPLAIGEAEYDFHFGTVVKAKPGQTLLAHFTLDNYANHDRKAESGARESLKTGGIRFKVLSKGSSQAVGSLKAAGEARSAQRTALEVEVRRTLEQQRDALREQLERLQRAFKTGTIARDRVLQAETELLKVELVLAEDAPVRIKVLKDILAVLKSIEEAAVKRSRTGLGTKSDVLEIQRQRTEVQHRLLEESDSLQNP